MQSERKIIDKRVGKGVKRDACSESDCIDIKFNNLLFIDQISRRKVTSKQLCINKKNLRKDIVKRICLLQYY